MVNEKICERTYYHTKIKEWPEDERPREKLLREGPGVLTDAELLALLIESGTGGVTAVDVGKRLLVEYRSMAELSSKGLAEITRMKGIGPARGAKILAAFEIGRRVEADSGQNRIRITAPEDVAKVYASAFRGVKKEFFKTILLDGKNQIIRDVTVSQGTLNASLVHPREVFKTAVDYLAAGIILMHNHPSGEAAPSREDHRVTEQMMKASEIMGIPVLDHVIIAGNKFYSFAQEGLIKK